MSTDTLHGRHRAPERELDAPTVALAQPVAAPAEPPAPQAPAPYLTRVLVAVCAAGVLLVVVAFVVVTSQTGSSASSSSAAVTPAQAQGTPLGCPASAPGEPAGQCLDATLASRLCDIDLNGATPQQWGDADSGQTTEWWSGSSTGMLVMSFYSLRGGYVDWRCSNGPAHLDHSFQFTMAQWRDLRTDGAPMPLQLAAALTGR